MAENQQSARPSKSSSSWDFGIKSSLLEASVDDRVQEAEQTRAGLYYLSRWLSRHEKEIPAAVTMLLSTDEEVRKTGIAEIAGGALSEGETGGAHSQIDYGTALLMAIQWCEARSAPVTTSTVRCVEDATYYGYDIRRFLSLWLRIGAMLLIAVAILSQSAIIAFDGRTRSGNEGADQTESAPVEPAGSPADDAAEDEVGAEPELGVTLMLSLRAASLVMWGVVGASFFLLRRLYHFTEERIFDHRMVGMYTGRLVMGGIAGLLLPLTSYLIFSEVDLINPRDDEEAFLTVGSTALAVLAGFGVRLVYAIFEKLLDEIVHRFDLDKLRGDTSTAE